MSIEHSRASGRRERPNDGADVDVNGHGLTAKLDGAPIDEDLVVDIRTIASVVPGGAAARAC